MENRYFGPKEDEVLVQMVLNGNNPRDIARVVSEIKTSRNINGILRRARFLQKKFPERFGDFSVGDYVGAYHQQEHRKYYGANASKLNETKRGRYETDNEYRESVKRANRERNHFLNQKLSELSRVGYDLRGIEKSKDLMRITLGEEDLDRSAVLQDFEDHAGETLRVLNLSELGEYLDLRLRGGVISISLKPKERARSSSLRRFFMYYHRVLKKEIVGS